jgi:hypothetical protein
MLIAPPANNPRRSVDDYRDVLAYISGIPEYPSLFTKLRLFAVPPRAAGLQTAVLVVLVVLVCSLLIATTAGE